MPHTLTTEPREIELKLTWKLPFVVLEGAMHSSKEMDQLVVLTSHKAYKSQQ